VQRARLQHALQVQRARSQHSCNVDALHAAATAGGMPARDFCRRDGAGPRSSSTAAPRTQPAAQPSTGLQQSAAQYNRLQQSATQNNRVQHRARGCNKHDTSHRRRGTTRVAHRGAACGCNRHPIATAALLASDATCLAQSATAATNHATWDALRSGWADLGSSRRRLAQLAHALRFVLLLQRARRRRRMRRAERARADDRMTHVTDGPAMASSAARCTAARRVVIAARRVANQRHAP
jgi:hypothetical protein